MARASHPGRAMRSLIGVCVLTLAAACGKQEGGGQVSTANPKPGGLRALMKERGLSEADVEAALLTYKPTGKKDDYVIFASGGQSGQVLAIGVPSMRLLKVIAVYSPEPWQGYGYGGYSDKVLAGGQQYPGSPLTWADVHHPNLSETGGEYDGKYLFVNDKANARIAVVDLRDFATKQIVPNKLVASDHGGAFVTPDTDYVIETSQYPAPLGREYAPLSEYKEKYRGLAMFWKFDKKKGRIIPEESWAVELPPYTQDLADCGKRASDGYVFINSFNTEMATGGVLEGNPPIETSCTSSTGRRPKSW
jgi:nitrous-oxide reductase